MSLPLPHKCPKLGIDNSTEDYQRYANFLALLAIIAGSDDFMKKIQTPISYVKQQTYIRDTDKGVIFVSSNDFYFEAGSEWVIGTCVKSPCVAAGNNELVSVYR